jgi:pyruvate kinase
VITADRLGLKALIVPTRSGRTAERVAAHRPRVSILAVSPRLETVRRLGLLLGVTAVQAEHDQDVRRLIERCSELAVHCGVAGHGDRIGVTAALFGEPQGTNLCEVHRVA